MFIKIYINEVVVHASRTTTSADSWRSTNVLTQMVTIYCLSLQRTKDAPPSIFRVVMFIFIMVLERNQLDSVRANIQNRTNHYRNGIFDKSQRSKQTNKKQTENRQIISVGCNDNSSPSSGHKWHLFSIIVGFTKCSNHRILRRH